MLSQLILAVLPEIGLYYEENGPTDLIFNYAMTVKMNRNFYEGNICLLQFLGDHQGVNRAFQPYNHFFNTRSGSF